MYKIITDCASDLPVSYYEEHNLGRMDLTYSIDGVTYEHLGDLDEKSFYAKMRDGLMTKTSQPSPAAVQVMIEEALEEYEGVLVIALSSGISGTYNCCCLARDLVLEDNPDAKIIVIDSLCASLGEGLLVHKAVINRDNGMSLEDNAKWIETNKHHLVHAFTVDDLMFLYRGGRVKKSSAVVGTIINLKPTLHIDYEGHLINLGTVRGRKKSLNWLVDYMEEHMGSYKDQNDVIFISHGDCEEDAQYVADQIKQKFGIDAFLINYIGTVIGAHSGPGTLALFFMGETR